MASARSPNFADVAITTKHIEQKWLVNFATADKFMDVMYVIK